jgi:hypothetical protein
VKLGDWGNVFTYAYVHNRTEIRLTKDSKHLNIVAQVSKDQQYATTDIYAEGENKKSSDKDIKPKMTPSIRCGYPYFQGVEGVRATVNSIFVTRIVEETEVGLKRRANKRAVFIENLFTGLSLKSPKPKA